MIIPAIYRYVGAVLVVGVTLYGAYRHGVSVTTTKLELAAALERDAATLRAVKLSTRISALETDLLSEQSREVQIRTVELIKYRTQYRDKIIKVPHIVECVNDSGLLDVINASMPTVTIEQTKQRPNDTSSFNAALYGRSDSRHNSTGTRTYRY